MRLNLGSILQTSALETPERSVLRFEQLALSFGQLDRAARGVATSLRARGLEPGQSVALFVPNLPEFSIAYFGILYAGCTVVPLNVLLTAREIAYHLDDSSARLLIAHPFFGAAARKGAETAAVPLVWAGGEEGERLAELAEAEPCDALHPSLATDTAVILYTSGTTGKPKGAELTHSNLLLNCTQVSQKLYASQPDDVQLAALPLFHSFGQTCIQNAAVAAGTCFTLLPRFTPEDAMRIIERDRVTIFSGVPAMYNALLHHQPERTYDLSSLRHCVSGGAPMPAEVMRAFEERYGVEILEGYGLSETSPVASSARRDRPRRAGSIGYPVWGVEMAILDDHDRAVPDGERGEICIRGHNVMKGYLGRPEATKEALRNGWFHSGDIGMRDPDGAFWIVDRKKDMILRGGFNVYPREVEEVLYTHPAVVEVAVIGVPDETHGEEVKALVVSNDPALDAETLIAWSKEQLAAYKYPRQVEFRDELPKGPTGKILKRELR